MSPCPVCSRPMPPVPPWRERRRVTCSKACAVAAGHSKVKARQSEVDQAAVVRLLEGWPVESTKGERVEAVRVLTTAGQSADTIAARLRITERTVCRYRAELHQREAVA